VKGIKDPGYCHNCRTGNQAVAVFGDDDAPLGLCAVCLQVAQIELQDHSREEKRKGGVK
jgi:hypothetical protein